MAITVAVDLRGEFGEVRLQGERSTCMAFSTSDCHSAARGSPVFLSPEFLHYHALRRRGFSNLNEGVAMSEMFVVVEEDGQPEESAWPYEQRQLDPVTWSPPPGCSPLHKRTFREEPSSVDQVSGLLDQGVVTVIVMSISRSFFTPPESGVIQGSPGESPINTHAVLAVGRGHEGSEELVLVRNSWGRDWGRDGYAWLSAAYLAPRLYAVGIAGAEVVST